MGLPMMPRPIKPMMGLFIFSTSSLGYCSLRSCIHQRLADVWCAIGDLLRRDGFGLGIFFRRLIMANCKPCRGGAESFQFSCRSPHFFQKLSLNSFSYS